MHAIFAYIHEKLHFKMMLHSFTEQYLTPEMLGYSYNMKSLFIRLAEMMVLQCLAYMFNACIMQDHIIHDFMYL